MSKKEEPNDASSEVITLRIATLGASALRTHRNVADEMARVYRMTARGQITTKLGGQLAFQLGVLSKTLEHAVREVPLLEDDAIDGVVERVQ